MNLPIILNLIQAIPKGLTDSEARGFGLVEAMIAMVLLATGFMALGQFLAASIQANRDVSQEGIAREKARAELEKLRYKDEVSVGSAKKSPQGSNDYYCVKTAVKKSKGNPYKVATLRVRRHSANIDTCSKVNFSNDEKDLVHLEEIPIKGMGDNPGNLQ